MSLSNVISYRQVATLQYLGCLEKSGQPGVGLWIELLIASSEAINLNL